VTQVLSLDLLLEVVEIQRLRQKLVLKQLLHLLG